MTAPTLRPYQLAVLAGLTDRIAAGARRILLVAPTGAGKTVIAAEKVRDAVAMGRRVLVLAHRRELIQQTHQKLFDLGIDAGIIQAGFVPRPGETVQVASVSTLWCRAFRRSAMDLPTADLVIVDEAHHARARTYRKIIEAYPEAVVIGMTATPCRSDGRGLGNIFEAIVECPSVADLIGLGFLVPTRVYAPSIPDLAGVTLRQGDYAPGELGQRMDRATLIGDIVEHWHRLAEHRKTVVFASSVAHSVNIRDEFRRAGVSAEHIDGSTPVEERDAILGRLSLGQSDVVSNCMVLTEGWDQPDVSCIVLARPTKHHGLFRQMLGRVLRPAPGKSDALVLDHAGAVFAHGFVEDPVIWSLDQDKRAELPAQASGGPANRRMLTTCPECHAVRLEGQPCSACGWQPRRRPEAPDVADGELARLDRDGRIRPQDWPTDERRRFHAMLLCIANERGYAKGWAAHKYKERFKTWPIDPAWAPPAPLTPDAATRAWVRSRQIAYAKAMQKQGAA